MTKDNNQFENRLAGTFRHILVGFDGSSDAKLALRVAVTLSSELGGEVRVLTVVRLPAHAETDEELERAADAEKENLSRGLSRVWEGYRPSCDVTTDVTYADDAAYSIAHYAEEHGFDLIVLGGHGREQIAHRGVGRSLEALLRHRSCPVLVV